MIIHVILSCVLVFLQLCFSPIVLVLTSDVKTSLAISIVEEFPCLKDNIGNGYVSMFLIIEFKTFIYHA